MSEILQQLGLNSTLLFQAGLFVITVIFLRYYVYSAYVAANEEREHRTTGSESASQDLSSQFNQLETQYEKKAKELNENVSQIFAKQRTMAAAEAERLVQDARAQALTSTEQVKKTIREEADRAKQQVPQEVKALAAMMVQKLLGKGA